jgi:hypothetical protein
MEIKKDFIIACRTQIPELQIYDIQIIWGNSLAYNIGHYCQKKGKWYKNAFNKIFKNRNK